MSDDFDEAIKMFRRAMLGPACAHMTDEQIAAYLKPYEALVDAYDDMPKAPNADEPSEPPKPESS